MMLPLAAQRFFLACCFGTTLLVALAGCTSPFEYVRNGFKVGPNFTVLPPRWRRMDRRGRQTRSQRRRRPE